MVALLLGSLSAVGLAFFAEYADNKVKSPAEVQEHLGLLCLGLVPKVTGTFIPENGPLINNDVPPLFAESFRKIRSNVIFAMSERRLRTLIVTSTGPNEGKTTVATNIALGLAMTRQRVLLIDADMRRSRVHQVLNQRSGPGLAELLAEQRSWDEVVHRYDPVQDIPLDLLLAGAEAANPAELLSSARCKAVLLKASRDYDWVIVDSPPVMAVTDASILANTPSDVLFVVGSEINRLQTITKALEQLEVAKASFVGAVLNQAKVDRNSFYYSDYVRREYGDYYSGAERVAARGVGRLVAVLTPKRMRS
jgi:capsular exopolysaccharide synthesis family protein